jgi:hypothetical protein
MNELIEDVFKVLLDRKVVTICYNKIAFQQVDDYLAGLQVCFLQTDEQIVIDLRLNKYYASNEINGISTEIIDFFNNSERPFSQFSFLDYFSKDFPEKKLFIILKNPFFLSDQNEDVTLIQKIRSLIEKIRFCENVFLVISMVESEKSGFYGSYYSELKSKYISQTYKFWITSSDT